MTELPEPPSVTNEGIHQHVQAGQDREELNSADATAVHLSILVPLQPKGFDTTVIFCPSFRKTAVFYHDIAGHLAPDMPVYSFNWPVPTTDNPPAETLETIAEEFMRDLERCIPHGPYVLGGYCFGAVIAIEMAKRLTAS